MKFIDYIRYGIKATDFFIYDSYEIKYRPLSSLEMDKVEEESLENLNDNLAKFIMNIKLGKIKLTDQLKSIPNALYKELRKYYMRIDYLIVYYGIKDFIEGLEINDVKGMKYIHELANKIVGVSSASKEKIIEVINTPDGVKLATVVFEWHQPLADANWNLTDLQKRFLYVASGKEPIPITKNILELENYELDNLMENMRHVI